MHPDDVEIIVTKGPGGLCSSPRQQSIFYLKETRVLSKKCTPMTDSGTIICAPPVPAYDGDVHGGWVEALDPGVGGRVLV